MRRWGWVLLVALGCESFTDPEPPEVDALALVSPAPATALAGSTLNLILRATDNGSPLGGQTVTFAVAGGGSVFPASAVTDMQGQVGASWTLGTSGGSNTLTASSGAVSLPVVVAARVPTPARLVFDSVRVVNNGQLNTVVRLYMRNAGEGRGMGRVQFWGFPTRPNGPLTLVGELPPFEVTADFRSAIETRWGTGYDVHSIVALTQPSGAVLYSETSRYTPP